MFGVGNKVVVKRNIKEKINSRELDSKHGYVHEMKAFEGETVTISKEGRTWVELEEDKDKWYWNKDWFEVNRLEGELI